MNEDEITGASADTGYEATPQEDGGFSFGLDGTDLDDQTAEGATNQVEGAEEEAGGEPAPDVAALNARIAALEEEAGRYRPYSKLFDMAQSIGPPDVFEEKLREQELQTQKNASRERSAQYIGQASQYARQRLMELAQAGEMEETAIDATETILHEILGSFADRLADVEPLITRIEHQDKVTMVGRTVSELMKPTADGGKGFEYLDEDAVKEAIVEGRDYLAVAKRTHERGKQLVEKAQFGMKAAKQEAAIKAGSPPSPPVEGVRRQSASTAPSLPDPIRDRENYLKARAEQKRRMDRGEPAY